MSTFNSTSQNIKKLVQQVSSLVNAIQQTGVAINTIRTDAFMIVVCVAESINKTIDLSAESAIEKLNALKNELSQVESIDLTLDAQ